VTANACHLLAVHSLYHLAQELSPRSQGGNRIAFLTATLHILSPAGLFLSAPYSESLFACLNIFGMLSYVHATKLSNAPSSDLGLLLAGLAFGAASTVRGNGILSGAIFAVDGVNLLLSFANRQPTLYDLRRLVILGIASLFVITGFVLPQVIAYREYCTGTKTGEAREWCHRFLPSISSWVQDYYWYVIVGSSVH
jgi:GPI mannosyltransferase 2